jgi:hypothetical protein
VAQKEIRLKAAPDDPAFKRIPSPGVRVLPASDISGDAS